MGRLLSDADHEVLRQLVQWWRGQGGSPAVPGKERPQATKAPWVYGKMDASLSAGGNAAMSVWAWSGSAWADSTENITVYAPPLLTTGTIASGDWVRADWHAQAARWYVVSAEC